ncbi:isoprenylcysteine carboxylmethyltransferase family protein [Flaviaesturariibacter amylovorans]|uniref:Isoprenylcysteine carboxylmethyltransferase family protein n=1 Tax=Flaviaesturariibacter amylovorans TaxID=1084520 RepID=A0ABP8GSS1_9BACT
MTEPHLLLALLWILFGVFHSALASGRFKRWLFGLANGARPYYRVGYTLFAFVSLGIVLWYQLALPSPRLLSPAWQPLGFGLATLGGVLMAVCIKKYFLSLSGLKSLFRHRELAPELRIDGVHRYVRHPLYLGTFVFIWGLFFLFPTLSGLIACVAIQGYTMIGIRYEEAKLLQDFGPAYGDYQAKVPRLLPLRRPLPRS